MTSPAPLSSPSARRPGRPTSLRGLLRWPGSVARSRCACTPAPVGRAKAVARDRKGLASAPIAVIMISRNEAHNMAAVLDNLEGFAQEVFLVDSFSDDDTVEIARARGVHVVQREFRGFGEQWNFALATLPVAAPWTMKLDPDERLTPQVKAAIAQAVATGDLDAFRFRRRLWFMGRPLHVKQVVTRGWRTGRCRFGDVAVNEHPIVSGRVATLEGLVEHHDSPSLERWLEKQNLYTSMEAAAFVAGAPLSVTPSLRGGRLERRMWLKANFSRLPMRFVLLHLYNLFATGAWRDGRTGRIWARLRTDVHRQIEMKIHETDVRRSDDPDESGERVGR